MAKQATHTPGPWEAKNWMVSNYPATPLKVICYTAHNAKTRTDENLANARLIAAAPALLAACKAALELSQAYDVTWQDGKLTAKLRAAIALAEQPGGGSDSP